MAGKTIRILEKTQYANLGEGLVATTGVAKVWVATNVDVSGYLYASLVLRLHAWTMQSGSGAPSISITGYASAPTAEDPATTFRGGVVLDGQGSGKIGYSATAAPQISVVSAALATLNATTAFAGAGTFLDFVLQYTNGTAAATQTTFTISADLVLRS